MHGYYSIMKLRSEYGFLCILMNALSQASCNPRARKRAPPDKYSLTDNETIFSQNFKNWNASLKNAKIIPDVLLSEVPQPLTVVYMQNNVKFGNLLKYNRIDEEPVDLDWLYKEGEFYTVVMSDPDFPDPKKPLQREYLHWMIINVKAAFITDGKNVAQYIPPSRRRFSTSNSTCKGLHRLVFVVYQQSKGKLKVSPDLYTPPDHQEHVDARPHNREKFSSMDFAKEHNLVPIAANYFMMNMDIVEKKDKKPLHVE
nr:PREDICTED: protein D1-like isoform X2 [Bemisia tabaci]